MRVLITGSTTWSDVAAIKRELVLLPENTTIVTGDTPGVDAIAIEVAGQLGLLVEPMRKQTEDYEAFPDAGWKGLNVRMLATGIDLVIAFNPDFDVPGKARGTRHAVTLAQEAGIEVRVLFA